MNANPVDTSTSLAGGPFAVRFQRLKAELHLKLIEMLDPTQLQRLSPDRLKRELRALAKRLIANSTELLSDVDRERLLQELLAEALGLGPLEPLLHDPTISDILVNDPNTVYVERNGRLELTPVVFAGEEHLRQLIQRIVSQVGRRTDESSPMVDARLPDGSRVHAILPPLALDGPALSIRRFGVRLTTEDLLALGTLPVELLTLFQAAVEARVSVLISGGTGSGKTTFLNVLSHYIPEEERLITIEDAAELKLQQKHVIRLETRPASIDGQGMVTTRDLVRNSLRMRPDRIIVGECRGAEALDMLQAMNTGHEGSLTTVHANDAYDALARLEMMVLMNNMDLPIPVLRQYISSGIPLIIQLTRLKGGPRKVTRVLELAGFGPDGYVVNEIFGFRQTGVTDGVATGEFYATGYVPRFLSRIRAGGIDIGDDLFAARVLEVSSDPFSDASSAVEVNLGATPADSGLHGRQIDSAYDVNLPIDSNYDVDLEAQGEYDETAYDEAGDEVAYEADPELEAFDEVAEDGVYEDLPEDETDGTPDEDDRR